MTTTEGISSGVPYAADVGAVKSAASPDIRSVRTELNGHTVVARQSREAELPTVLLKTLRDNPAATVPLPRNLWHGATVKACRELPAQYMKVLSAAA